MKLEEAKNKLQEMIGLCTEEPKHITYNEEQAIEVILNHLTKQEKMIELMSKSIRANDIDEDICQYEGICNEYECEECIKQYFEKKAEESE